MARVLWYGDAGSHTGFARVTHEIVPSLVRDYQHDVHILALNYPGDWIPEIDGLKLYKANAFFPSDTYGTRRIVEMIERVRPEVIVLLHDPAALMQLLFQNRSDQNRMLARWAPVIAYIPVDGYNYPPEMVEVLPRAVNLVAMSEHGRSIFPGSKLVYHGVNTQDFHPIDKREAKRELDHDPDGFLVLRVDKNSGRKDIAATVHAMAPILEQDRTVALHLHTSTDPQTPGVMLDSLLSRYDFGDDQVVVSDFGMIGWDQDRLNVLYNAADLFVTTSRGEGFGLTIAEALACETPVVAQAVSAIPEVVGPGGVLIAPERRLTVPAGQDLWLPDINAFTEAIWQLRNDPERRQELGKAGREHVSRFTWTYATRRFNDFIAAAAAWRASTEADDDGPG